MKKIMTTITKKDKVYNKSFNKKSSALISAELFYGALYNYLYGNIACIM